MEGAPQDPNHYKNIEIFSDDEIKQIKDAHKRLKAAELRKMLKRVKALDAIDAEYDEAAQNIKSNIKLQLGKLGLLSDDNTDDNSDDSDNTK